MNRIERIKRLEAKANDWVEKNYNLSQYGFTRDVANAAYYAGYMAAMEQLCCDVFPPKDETAAREQERYKSKMI